MQAPAQRIQQNVHIGARCAGIDHAEGKASGSAPMHVSIVSIPHEQRRRKARRSPRLPAAFIGRRPSPPFSGVLTTLSSMHRRQAPYVFRISPPLRPGTISPCMERS